VTFTHVAQSIINLLQAFEKSERLISKVFGATTDNGSNVMNAIVDHHNLIHIPCIGHTI